MRDCRGGFGDAHSLGSGLFGFWPAIELCIARLGFESVVARLGIEVSVLRSTRDSVAGTASGILGMISLGGPSSLSVSQISQRACRADG
jgi:hypothetical protein